MSVKDRISKMNSLIVVETEKAQEPEKPIMRSLSLDVSLRFKGSETKSKGSVSYLKSRSSDGSMRSPLKLPGMEMEKGGEFKVQSSLCKVTPNTEYTCKNSSWAFSKARPGLKWYAWKGIFGVHGYLKLMANSNC